MNFAKCSICGSPFEIKDVIKWGQSVEVILGCTNCKIKQSSIEKISKKKKEKIYFVDGKMIDV